MTCRECGTDQGVRADGLCDECHADVLRDILRDRDFEWEETCTGMDMFAGDGDRE